MNVLQATLVGPQLSDALWIFSVSFLFVFHFEWLLLALDLLTLPSAVSNLLLILGNTQYVGLTYQIVFFDFRSLVWAFILESLHPLANILIFISPYMFYPNILIVSSTF